MVDKKGSLNIWKIAKGDFNKVRNNTIAWIVIIGLTIVPSLYAWFNIAASWDPYSNTGNLKVAVASEDEGYSGELTAINLNIGDTVLSSLRENDALDWVFTDSEEAVQGVKDGSYYAALVIPKSFSRDMMSFFTPDVKRSDIIYYLNEKENAIAPKITDKGASAVKNQIDSVFARSLTDIALEIAKSLFSIMEKGDSNKYMNAFLDNMDSAAKQTSQSAKMLESFANLTDSLADIASTSAGLGAELTKSAGNAQELLAETSGSISTAASDIERLGNEIMSVLNQVAAEYDSVADDIDRITDIASDDADVAVSRLEALKEKIGQITKKLTALRDSVQRLYEQIPEDFTGLRGETQKLIDSINELIGKQENVQKLISDAVTDIKKAQTAVTDVKKICRKLRQDIDVIRTKYVNEIEPQITELAASFIETNTALSSAFDKFDILAAELTSEGKSAAESLTETGGAIRKASSAMLKSSKELKKISVELRNAVNSGETEKIQEIIGSDTDALSDFLSAPVELDKKIMYPVENYGSAMAPFYTVLAIWVGAIVMAAMLKVSLTEERKTELEDLKDYQAYFGRMIFFVSVSVLQSGLVCLGDLFFLEIQCVHPWLFLIAGWLTGIVFAIIMYSLTISFGDVGKAIAVILLVIQVAGSGGTFPIEMTPQFFQNMAEFMPFTYAMSAMRECIGGLYGNTYRTSLGCLAIYAAAFIFLGVVLRKPVIKLNEKIAEKLEGTKLM